MVKGFFATVAGVVLLSTTSAFAQVQDQRQIEQSRRRAQLVNMEHVLTQAVRTGARGLVTKLGRVAIVEDAMLMGTPEAHGFVVETGMFFHVRVPTMSSLFLLEVPGYAEQRRYQVQATQTQPVVRAFEGPPPVAPVDTEVLKDPQAAYRHSVKDAVIAAMIENGGALRIAPNESLTVAVRRDSRPNPLDLTDEVPTTTFSITGKDLESYQQNRLTMDQVRKLVVTRED